jgi:hypothetical protein
MIMSFGNITIHRSIFGGFRRSRHPGRDVVPGRRLREHHPGQLQSAGQRTCNGDEPKGNAGLLDSGPTARGQAGRHHYRQVERQRTAGPGRPGRPDREAR